MKKSENKQMYKYLIIAFKFQLTYFSNMKI